MSNFKFLLQKIVYFGQKNVWYFDSKTNVPTNVLYQPANICNMTLRTCGSTGGNWSRRSDNGA